MRRFEINPKYHLQHIEESIAEQAKEIERYTQFIKNLEGFLFKLIPLANAVEKISKNFYETFSSRTYVETVESLQNELKAMIDYLAKVKWSPAHQELKEKSWIPALENCLPLLNILLDTQLGQISETVKLHETETLPALNGSLNTIKEQILNNITVLAKLRHKHNKKMQDLIQEKQALTSTHESSAKQQKSKEQQESMEEEETGTLEFAAIEDVPTVTPSIATMTTTSTEDQFSRMLSRASSLYRSLRQLQAYMVSDDASLGQHHEGWQMFSKSLFMFINYFETNTLDSDLNEYKKIVLGELKKCWDNIKNISPDPSQRIVNAAILAKVAVHLWNAKNAIKNQQEILQGKRPSKVKDQPSEEIDENAVIAIALGQELLNTKDINKYMMLANIFRSLPENARELSPITDSALKRHAIKLIDGVKDVTVFDRFLVDAINNKTLFVFELFLLASHKTELPKLFIQQLSPAVEGMNFYTIHYDLSTTSSSPFVNATQTNQFVSLLAWIIDSEWIGGLDYFLNLNGLKNQKNAPNVVTLTAYPPPPTGTNLEARSPVDRYTFFEYALKNERYQVLAYLIKNSLVPDDAANKLISSISLKDVRKQKLLLKLLLTNNSYFSPVLIELAISKQNLEVLKLLLDGFQSYYQDMALVCTHLEKAALYPSIFNQILDSALKHYRSTGNDMAFLNLLVASPVIFELLVKTEKELATLIFLPLLEQDRLSKSLIESLRVIICSRMDSMNDFFELLQSIPQKHFTTVLHEIFTSDFILQYPEVLEFALLAKEEGDSKLANMSTLMLEHIENLEKLHETKSQKKTDTMYNPPSLTAIDTILHRAIRRGLPHAYEYLIAKAPALSLRSNGEGKQPIELLQTNSNWPSIIRDNREKRFAKIFAKHLKIEPTEILFWDGNSQLKSLFATMQESAHDKKHPIPTLKAIGSKHTHISKSDKLRRGDIVVAFCTNIEEVIAFKTALDANPNIVSLLIIPPSLAKTLPKDLYHELQLKYRCLGPVIANDTDLERLTKTLLASLERLASYFKKLKDEPVKKIEYFMTDDDKQAVEAEIEEREAFEIRKQAFELLSQYIDDQCKKPDTKGFKLWKQLTSGSSKSGDIEAAVKLRNYLLGLDLSLNAEDNLKPFYKAFTSGELATVCRSNPLLSRILKNLSYSGPGR